MELGRTKIDQQAVQGGVWTEFLVVTDPSQEPEVIKLKMALANANVNKAYKKALRSSMEPFERIMSLYEKASEIPTALAQKINDAGRRVFVETIVLDWEGPTRDGKPIPYSADECLKVFEEFPELLAQAEAEAGKLERYRTAALESAAGN